MNGTFRKPALASVIMGAAVYLMMDLNLLIIILLASCIYFGVLILIRTFDEEDKVILMKLMGRSP